MIDTEISGIKRGGVRVRPSGVRIEIARVVLGTASTRDVASKHLPLCEKM